MKKNWKILIIDDNEDFRLALNHLLTSQGYPVIEASNGEQALEVMESAKPNMAIVDLDMPKLNGIEFSKRAKRLAPRFPIVMVTAYAQFYSTQDILSAGVDAFLQKPVDWNRIVEIVEQFSKA